MKPSDALEQNRDAIKNLIARFPVTNPRIFGSVTHKADTDNSDLDLLVDALPGTTLFDLGGLQSELEDLLGIHVDLITPGDLPLRVRQQVVTQAIPI